MLRLAALVLPPGRVAAGVAAPVARPAAVVGGRPADAGEWPWQVALLIAGRQSCGGTLVELPTRPHGRPLHRGRSRPSTSRCWPAPSTSRWRPAPVGSRPSTSTRSTTPSPSRNDIALLELAEPFELGDAIGARRPGRPTRRVGRARPRRATRRSSPGSVPPARSTTARGCCSRATSQAFDDDRCLDVYREHGHRRSTPRRRCAPAATGERRRLLRRQRRAARGCRSTTRARRGCRSASSSWGAGCGEPGLPNRLHRGRGRSSTGWPSAACRSPTGVQFEGAGHAHPGPGHRGQGRPLPAHHRRRGLRGRGGARSP